MWADQYGQCIFKQEICYPVLGMGRLSVEVFKHFTVPLIRVQGYSEQHASHQYWVGGDSEVAENRI